MCSSAWLPSAVRSEVPDRFMARERNTERKRSKTPPRSLFQSAPAQVMGPRLMVILSTFALLAVGLVMVYSSSSITSYVEQGNALGETVKQCAFALIGIVIAVVIAFTVKQDSMQGRGGLVFWGICAALILLTAVLGTVGLGAKRWLIIGPISIQISEFAKIAFVMMGARIAAQYREGLLDESSAKKQVAVLVAAPLIFMFFAQSDLGTTLICCIGLFSVLVLSGLSGRNTAVLIVVSLVVVAAAVLSKSYRADRLGNFMDPWSDAQGTGYQLVHSFKALASGGLFGAGIGNSYEKLQYLPEAETDFIFAIIGEELGLVGALLVIVAFLVFLRGGFLIASQASTPFGSLLAAGLTVMIVFQAFLNISCVVGLFPTTGKPLPFISSGGSSLLSSLTLVGVLLSISFDSNNEGEYRQRRDNLQVVSKVPSSGRAVQTERGSNGRGARTHRSALSERSGRPSLQVVRAEKPPAYAAEVRVMRTQRR